MDMFICLDFGGDFTGMNIHIYVYKYIYTLNMYILLYVNNTLIKLFYK